MTIGPVQLLVLGFDKPDFKGEIIEEFERLRESDTVRVIDALVVYKDAEGEVAVLKGSQLSKDEAQEFAWWLWVSAAGKRRRRARSRARPRRRRRVFDEESMESWRLARRRRSTHPPRAPVGDRAP
jgi:hypothetical protein